MSITIKIQPISSNLSITSRFLSQQKQVDALEEKNNSGSASVPLNTLQAYSLNKAQKVSFGLTMFLNDEENGVKIQKDNDTNELILKVRAGSDAKEARLVYKIVPHRPSAASRKTEFTLSQPNYDGYYNFRIPVLERETNTFLKSIEVSELDTYDNSGMLIQSNFPDGLRKISVNEIFSDENKKVLSIGNEKKLANFFNLSPGNVEGRLVKVSNAEEYEHLVKNYNGKEPRIVYLTDFKALHQDMLRKQDDFYLPKNIKGIITGAKLSDMLVDSLGHLASRLRNRQVVSLCTDDTIKMLDTFFNRCDKHLVSVSASTTDLKFMPIKKLTVETPPAVDKETLKTVLVPDALIHEDTKRFSKETVGLKAYNLGKLAKLSQTPVATFKVPPFFVVSAGLIDEVKRHSENFDIYGKSPNKYDHRGIKKLLSKDELSALPPYHARVANIERLVASNKDPHALLEELQDEIIDDMHIPSAVRAKIMNKFVKRFGELPDGYGESYSSPKVYTYDADSVKQAKPNKKCYIARSSFVGEDSPELPTPGLYGSYAGIRTDRELYLGIKKVWASKWSDLAYRMRHDYGIAHEKIQPNIIIQEVMPVDYTFTLYTAKPTENDKSEMHIQLSKGIDSGFTGNPYLFKYDRTERDVKDRERPRAERVLLATKGRMKNIDLMLMDDVSKDKYLRTNYAEEYDVFNLGAVDYSAIIEKIAQNAILIEKMMGGKPQDIEGGIKFVKKGQKYVPELYIWQTRDIYYPKDKA